MIETYVAFCLPPLIVAVPKYLSNYAVVWSVIDCRIVVVISGLLAQHHKTYSDEAQPSKSTSEIWTPCCRMKKIIWMKIQVVPMIMKVGSVTVSQ
jgi:hypothetical protein